MSDWNLSEHIEETHKGSKLLLIYEKDIKKFIKKLKDGMFQAHNDLRLIEFIDKLLGDKLN